ncbi:hypothetical protein LOZ61_006306 [Ophidiomyces ophidiicola]|nr:hypothetical protein LOZ61_006306 [Ophidiomyces ophidiicola]KAI1927777.1 hypothetical protein LOZ60_002891 [Ophidiomyces ophidiicola]KAI2031127.1 hypothetical protein LOZ48_002903 [Ophidiomyces ophidiicola]KAI2033537.1 hypothetical protein LOZ45_000821 [Ophidiomyces ophidiicola]KAI2063239.1 hypothetical protein LOZ40_005530 [Ophidiomyces ophidiicola]
MAHLLTLPPELLDLVLSLLAPPVPSLLRLRAVPDHLLSASPICSLKAVSLVAWRLRVLSQPHLFSHARYELSDQHRFLTFVEENGLGRHIHSLVVSVRLATEQSSRWWMALLEHVNPEILTIIAPPCFLAQLAHVGLEDTHPWAFDLPFQILHLRRPPQKISRFQAASAPHTTSGSDTTTESASIFTACPWTEILFNEGSSLQGYRNDGYFLLRLPSFMDHWGYADFFDTTALPYSQTAILRLTSFHYTSIFPFYNHTNLVLRMIRNMANLRHLSVQLAPSPGDLTRIFNEDSNLGHMDPSDPWMELDTSYSLISHCVKYLGQEGKLEEFQTWDFELEALRDSILEKMDSRLRGRWSHRGMGVWTRLGPLDDVTVLDTESD